ncbi:ABC transporter ATP-binding protein [Coprothermobacteraceae bacterium]|nr:ABC transporter ATP-binding protein [Coprothermobacteraceae bacterium]
MINIPELKFCYGSRFTLSVPKILIDRFPAFMVGANGSGKTTLLRIIGGFIRIQTPPQIIWHGNWVPVKPRYFAYLPAQPYYEPSFSVRSYLLLAGNEEKLHEIAEELELSRILSYRMGTLSSGWLQRVLIARILLQDTSYVLMDEPTSFLDPEARKELLNILAKHPDKKMVISSHDLAFLSGFGAFVLGLRDGRVVFSGDPKTFFQQGIDDVFIKGYIM